MPIQTNPFGQQSERKRKPSALATTLGAIAAFFATPLIQAAVVGPVGEFTADHYGYDFEWVVDPATWVGSAALAFFSVQAAMPRILKMIEAKGWDWWIP